MCGVEEVSLSIELDLHEAIVTTEMQERVLEHVRGGVGPLDWPQGYAGASDDAANRVERRRANAERATEEAGKVELKPDLRGWMAGNDGIEQRDLAEQGIALVEAGVRADQDFRRVTKLLNRRDKRLGVSRDPRSLGQG